MLGLTGFAWGLGEMRGCGIILTLSLTIDVRTGVLTEAEDTRLLSKVPVKVSFLGAFV